MPWGRLDDTLYDHPKLDDFPTDEPTLRRIVESMPLEDLIRLAGVGLWARAISYSNRHLTDGAVGRSVVIRKLGASAELADAVAHAALFDQAPTGYHVHDFLDFNDSRTDVLERREKEAKRKAEYRRSKRSGSRPNGTDHGTSNGDGPDVPPVVPPSVPQGVPAGVPQVSRARTRGIRESRPDPTRPDPTRPTESLRRESARTARADVQALLDRGWSKVTRAQRKVLDEILARHDVTGPEFAAEAIRNAAPDADPLRAAIEADAAWQVAQRRRADAEEAEHEARKAEEREGAPAWLAGIAR